MKCEIEWIDCHGHKTPDTNDAVGYAVLNGERRFPICEEHLSTLYAMTSHHPSSGTCSHRVTDTRWTFEPFEATP